MPEVADPEHANPLAATLWEFVLAKVRAPLGLVRAFPLTLASAQTHYHPSVVDYTARVLQAFVEADGSAGGSAVCFWWGRSWNVSHSLTAKPVPAPGGVSPAAKSEAMALFKAFDFDTVGFNPPIPKPRTHPLEKMLRKQSKVCFSPPLSAALSCAHSRLARAGPTEEEAGVLHTC